MRHLVLLPLLLLLNGCATWEGLSPTTQAVLKAGAKLALSYGVHELGQSVKELRPYQDKLNSLIETTFSKAIAAEDAGEALKKGVAAIVPPEHRAAVLANFKESLTGAKTTAAAPKNHDYNRRVAGKL